MDNWFINIFKNKHNLPTHEFMKLHDVKNRFLYPYFPTIIIDDFYDDCEIIRHFALQQEFYKGDRGNWPGLRTTLLHELNYDIFQIFLKKILFILKDYGITEITRLETAFQLINENYGNGWVHDDDPQDQVAGVIYLNHSAPLGSGTAIYKDCSDHNGEFFKDLFEQDVNQTNEIDSNKFEKYRKDQRSKFETDIIIESKFNRFILFDTRNWHSAETFFGKGKDARLTQVFFVKI